MQSHSLPGGSNNINLSALYIIKFGKSRPTNEKEKLRQKEDTMVYKNALVYLGRDSGFKQTDLKTNGEIIEAVGNFGGEGEDCTGKVILPGFIDIHIHGCNGYDCTDGNPQSAAKMSEYLASRGVTSFCPATMTVGKDQLRASFSFIAKTMGSEKGAYIHGINMEGPFISPNKKGAQSADNILNPDINFFRELNEICPVKLVDIAPEMPGAEDFTAEAGEICIVSAAHTEIGYDQAVNAFDKGISHVTHLFNAMTQFGSREPGLVGAAFDYKKNKVMCELICDGIHISPATLRTAFSILGDRAVVISDSMSAAGLPDGEYSLGGQTVFKRGDARLSDGTLAGSVTDLFSEFRNLISFGIPSDDVINALTLNPAASIGADGYTGSVTVGKNADFIILNREMSEIEATIVKGRRVF